MYINLDIHRRRERHGARIIKHSANEEEEERRREAEARRSCDTYTLASTYVAHCNSVPNYVYEYGRKA